MFIVETTAQLIFVTTLKSVVGVLLFLPPGKKKNETSRMEKMASKTENGREREEVRKNQQSFSWEVFTGTATNIDVDSLCWF